MWRLPLKTADPSESDPRLLTEILVILPPAALAQTNGFVIFDELDCANVFHHGESKLRFNAKPEWRSVQNWQGLSVHFVGKHRLRIFRQLHANCAVEVSRALRMWFRRGFVVERAEDDVSGGSKRLAEFNDVMQRYATPLGNARPALNAAMLCNLSLFRHGAEVR